MDDRLEQLRAELRRLVGSMEYAYAMGSARALGTDPRLDDVRLRVERLERQIAALSSKKR